MLSKFIKGNVYVFTKKKFIKDMGKKKYQKKKGLNWVDKINGGIVKINGSNVGNIHGYSVDPDWCKCISNKNNKSKEI